MAKPAAQANNPTIFDGSMDFSGGVNSICVTTVQSPRTPNGLPRNSLAWLVNGTVRDGGISPREGWVYRGTIAPGSSLFQGAHTYEPDAANPYIMALIGGNTYQVDPDFVSPPKNLTAAFPGTAMPPAQPQAFFAQGESFLVIQSGDNVTLPLFWDGTTLRRSNGIITAPNPATNLNLIVEQGWVIPPVGSSVVVTLTGTYPGGIGDTITWLPYGTFTVTAISGNTITLTTVNSTLTGATVIPGTYTVSATSKSSTVYNVTTTNSFTWFANGRFEADLNAGTPYGGAVGDIVQWVGFGNLTVLGISSNKLTVVFQINSTSVATDPIVAGNYVWVASAGQNPPSNVLSTVTTTGMVNFGPQYSTFQVVLNAAYGGPANIGGTIFWTDGTKEYGQFVLLAISSDKKTLTLQIVANPGAVASANAGTYSFTEVVPNSSPVKTLTSELPAAGPMVYYQGRLWYAQQRTVSAGDIVSGPSGTLPYNFKDSILKVTENPLAIGGDGFSVPTSSGNIRGLTFIATLDTSLGQGNLIIFTRKSIYSLFVPISRNDWIAASASNMPLMTIIQNENGGVNDRSIVAQNGDIYFQSLEPSIRSLMSALRYFQQWANPPTSSNENRILEFVDRGLMHFGSGVSFNNRLLQATLPVQKPQGCIQQAVLPLDFTPLSTLNAQKPPNWEGHYEGLDHLQVLEMDFGGLQRAFSIVLSRLDQSIELWEFVVGQTTDVQKGGTEARIQMQIETPAWTGGDEDALKRLVGGEIWVDTLIGTVDFKMEYRVDGDVCWKLWKSWRECAPRNSCETVQNPQCYPLIEYGPSYRNTMSLPVPPTEDCESATGRPAYVGFQFQCRLTVTGYCRVRKIQVFMEPMERERYSQLVC